MVDLIIAAIEPSNGCIQRGQDFLFFRQRTDNGICQFQTAKRNIESDLIRAFFYPVSLPAKDDQTHMLWQMGKVCLMHLILRHG